MGRCDDSVLKRLAVVYRSNISHKLKPTKIRRVVFDHSMKESWHEGSVTGEHI